MSHAIGSSSKSGRGLSAAFRWLAIWSNRTRRDDCDPCTRLSTSGIMRKGALCGEFWQSLTSFVLQSDGHRNPRCELKRIRNGRRFLLS